jgi:hypothetical protein
LKPLALEIAECAVLIISASAGSIHEQLGRRIERHVCQTGSCAKAVALDKQVKDLDALLERELIHAPEYNEPYA